MRTCPNCGKDTRAETVEPCTRCGFSPAAPPEIGHTTYGGDANTYGPAPSAPPAPTGSRAPSPPTPSAPAPTRTERKRGGLGRLVFLLIILGAFGSNLLGGVGDLFDSNPGPTQGEAEEALTNFATAQAGLFGAVVACPEDAEKTEVGASFECTVTLPSGESTSVTVTNHADDFEWEGRPFLELRRAQ